MLARLALRFLVPFPDRRSGCRAARPRSPASAPPRVRSLSRQALPPGPERQAFTSVMSLLPGRCRPEPMKTGNFSSIASMSDSRWPHSWPRRRHCSPASLARRVAMADFLLAAAGFVLATVALGLLRILRGPGDADRVMAAQLLGTGGIAALLLLAEAMHAPAARRCRSGIGVAGRLRLGRFRQEPPPPRATGNERSRSMP